MTLASLRTIEPRDHSAVLALNAQSERALSPMGEERLGVLLGLVDRGDVMDVDGVVAGFVFTFAPDSSYDSPNYQAFSARYGRDFYYLDRIAIDDEFRRQGLGSLVYDEIERIAAPYSRLVLEVNSVPPNEVSLAFHRGRGFAEVGILGDETKAVTLMAKELGGQPR